MTELVFRENPYARSCAAVVRAIADGAVAVDRTVFFAAGGGQPGDAGVLRAGGVEMEIVDARKSDHGVAHVLASGARPPEIGAEVELVLDWPRRHRHMRMHSALHLLCAAVGEGVTGGQIGESKSRLDFDLDGKPDKAELQARLDRWVAEDRPISARWIEAAEFESRPELVRTLSVAPPSFEGRVRLVEIDGVDLQACGGTHVASTGEIGSIQIAKIENKGKRNRRINLFLAD